MGIADRLKAVLGFDEGRDVLHRPGTVERHHGGDVTEGSRFQFLDITAHAGPFQLENARRFSGGEQGKRSRVIHRYIVQVNFDAVVLGDDFLCLTQYGEVGQAEDVHLKETDLGDISHGELRHYRFLASALAAPLQRNVFVERFPGNDHPSGVGAGMTGYPFHLPRGVDQIADYLVILVYSPELVVLIQGPGQRHGR
ncbi:hypothetical protein ES703_39334 [subsurface metagenome]